MKMLDFRKKSYTVALDPRAVVGEGNRMADRARQWPDDIRHLFYADNFEKCDIMIAAWQDPTQPYEVAAGVLKGSDLYERFRKKRHGRPVAISYLSVSDREHAEELRIRFGEGKLHA